MLRPTAAVVVLLGGLAVPGLLHAKPNGFELDAAAVAELEAVKKRMEPKPYKPEPGGCARWKGRELIARYDPHHKPEGCVNHCAVKLTEADGTTGRWAITGERCSTR